MRISGSTTWSAVFGVRLEKSGGATSSGKGSAAAGGVSGRGEGVGFSSSGKGMAGAGTGFGAGTGAGGARGALGGAEVSGDGGLEAAPGEAISTFIGFPAMELMICSSFPLYTPLIHRTR